MARKQREQLHAGGKLGEEAIEARQRQVGIGGVGERRDQQRLHLGQALARPRAAHGGIAAVMPAAHARQHLPGLREPHLLQRGEGGRIVPLAGKHHVDPSARELGAVLEQGRVVALHRLQAGDERSGEGCHVRVAAEPRKAGKPLWIVGHLVRLLVGDHLQPVLDAAQEDVGFGKILRHGRLDPAARGEPLQRVERARRAQVRLAAAGDELLRLHEELDLADAAAPELDVVAGNGDVPEAAVGVDLPLHGVDVGDRREVEILAPDERREVRRGTAARPRCRRRTGAP